jgi:mannose-6-phosphate isomerase
VFDESEPVRRERLFDCTHFQLSRLRANSPFLVGTTESPTVLVGIEGTGQVEHDGIEYTLNKGGTILLPAVVGMCTFRPQSASTLLEISLPKSG